MKLQTIYRIVANEVDDTMPSEEVMNIARQVKETCPDDSEEVLEALECMEEEDEEIGDCMDENDEEGIRQDPTFISAIDDYDNQE